MLHCVLAASGFGKAAPPRAHDARTCCCALLDPAGGSGQRQSCRRMLTSLDRRLESVSHVIIASLHNLRTLCNLSAL